MQENQPDQLKDIVARIDRQIIASKDPMLSMEMIQEADSETVKTRHVFVQKGHFFFAIPISNTVELSPLGKVTSLPMLPVWIHGVASLRGEVVSVIDLPAYYGWSDPSKKAGEHIVVVEHGDVKVGIGVDTIIGSGDIDLLSELQSQAKHGQEDDVVYKKGYLLDERLYCIINVQELLAESRMLQW
ncbi:MAG: chemotaxis protein CheW [Desulfotalea sp.]